MSIFPSPFLAKLQDLKLWQGNYESLLQNKSREINNPSDFESIEGISALESTQSSVNMSEKDIDNCRNIEWDKKVVTPCKPFEQLLEEKLAEDRPVVTPVKPKKPFLKKGSGLVRYRMSYPQKKNLTNKLSAPISLPKNSLTKNISSKQSYISPRHNNCFNRVVSRSVEHSPLNLEPTELKMPDINIKPKGTWVKVQQNGVNFVHASSKSCNGIDEPNQDNQDDIIGRMNEFALRNLMPSSPKNEFKNKSPQKS